MDVAGDGDDLDTLMAAFGMGDGEQQDHKDISKSVEELEEKITKLLRASKLADVATKEALRTQTQSRTQKVRFALNDLQDSMEHAEKLKGDVTFEIRFNKDKDNNALTAASVMRRCNQIDECVMKLVEDVKCLRALVPKAISNF